VIVKQVRSRHEIGNESQAAGALGAGRVLYVQFLHSDRTMRGVGIRYLQWRVHLDCRSKRTQPQREMQIRCAADSYIQRLYNRLESFGLDMDGVRPRRYSRQGELSVVRG